MEFTTPITAAEVDVVMWRAWLADPDTRRRFEALVYRRGERTRLLELGALSSTGTRQSPRRTRRAGRNQARCAKPDRDLASASIPVVPRRHRGALGGAGGDPASACDEAKSCQNGEHLLIGTQPENVLGLPGPARSRRRLHWPITVAPCGSRRRDQRLDLACTAQRRRRTRKPSGRRSPRNRSRAKNASSD